MKTLKKQKISNQRPTHRSLLGSSRDNIEDDVSNSAYVNDYGDGKLPTLRKQLRTQVSENQLNKREEARYTAYVTERKKQVESYANEDNRDKRSRIQSLKKQRLNKVHKRHLDSPSVMNSVEYFNSYLQHPEAIEQERTRFLEEKRKGNR